MRKSKFYNKILSSCLVVLCLVFAMIFAIVPAKAAETESIKTVTVSNYSADALTTLIQEQREAKYLYAGLYKSGTTVDNLTKANAIASPKAGESYEAKFVTEEVMGIQAQVSDTLLENESATSSSIRVVTAIDSLIYREVGFSIKKENANGTELVQEGTISKYVYTKLYAVDATAENKGEPITYTPQDIHPSANYFKTYTLTGVPAEAYNTDLIVVPYWKTYDGQTVYGTTGIKTVNLGRSWVYINTSANTDETEYGTYAHPYKDLADALDAIVLDKNGKIIIQSSCANSTFPVPADFKWEKHGKDLTITGEGEQTEILDFSSIQTLIQRDGVTFTNMTLKLYTEGALYANGNRLKIDETVISDNSTTTIYGGGSGDSSSVSGTDVTILAGTYMAIYGGGRLGTVDGDTHVTIRNANVYSTEGKNTYRYVCGGGKNGNVTGSTYVTIGEGFNKDLEWDHPDHKTLSLVCGGGYAAEATNTAIVEGNTYVVIEDDNKTNDVDGAKASYVYGAGVGYSEVQGTSYVTCDGGYVMSINGGGATNAKNSSTSVVMKDGQVEQIFGGNSTGMTGNADVHILGGSILRRVYAGCYNNYAYVWESSNAVNGYTTITFGPDTNPDSNAFAYASLAEEYSKGDASYYAVSRYKENYTSDEGNEVGVFVVNDYNVEENPNKDMVGYTDFMSSFSTKSHHYLVNATAGGAVYSEGDSIRVIPDENKVATVRVGSEKENEGTVHAYITSEGVCKLPELDSSGTTNVYVVFTDEPPSDVTVGDYEATANGTHYKTLEEAISVANTLSTTTETDKAVVVTLLKNAEVEETLNIAESANITIQNADGVTATVNRADGLTDSSLLNVANGAKVAVNGIILDGRSSSEIAAKTTELTSLTKGSVSLVTVSGEADFTNATIQYTYTSKEGAGVYIANSGKVTMTGGAISNNYTEGSGGAVSVYSGAFIMNNGTINNNIAEKAGGAIIVRTGSGLTMNDGTISDNTTLVSGSNGGGAIFQHKKTTMNINGGTISNNISENAGGAIYVHADDDEPSSLTIKNATISGNKANHSENGAGGAIYVVANASLTLEGGATFQNNKATTNGGALAILGIVTEKEGTSCTFTGNQAVNGGAIYVSGTFTMEGANIDSNNATAKSDNTGGGGVFVDSGTFAMNGGTIQKNTTGKYGAGVLINAGSFNMTGGNISNHTISGEGAGLCICNNGTATMTGDGSYIKNNTLTSGSGAGVSVRSGVFTMNGGTIDGNTAKGSGGGLIVRCDDGFKMNSGTLSNNTAQDGSQGGGAIYLAKNMGMSINGGKLSNNSSSNGNGGAIFTGASTTVTLKDVVFTENSVAKEGGAIYVNSSASVTADNVQLTQNTATGNGGAIYMHDTKSSLTASNCIFTGNTATGNGGAISVVGSVTGKGCTFTGNNATCGGAISVGLAVDTTTTDDSGNEVTVTAYTNGSLVTTDCAIKDNTATKGAGVYVLAGTYEMNSSEIESSSITGNAATGFYGGGVYIEENGTFTMNGGTVSNNTVGDNVTDAYGAGVYIDSGAFEMNGGTISGHGTTTSKVRCLGPGVCIANAATFTMAGGAIENNHTSRAGGAIYIDATGVFNMTGGTINDNTASSNGGAIYVVAGNDNVTIDGGKIYKNQSTSGNGGAIAAYGANTIKLTSGTICGNTGKNADVDGVFINDTDGTCKIEFGANFNMGPATIEGETLNSNSIRYHTLRDRSGENAEPILVITGDSLTCHTSSNPLNLKLYGNKTNVQIKIQCDSNSAALAIAEALEQTYSHTWSAFTVENNYIISTRTK